MAASQWMKKQLEKYAFMWIMNAKGINPDFSNYMVRLHENWFLFSKKKIDKCLLFHLKFGMLERQFLPILWYSVFLETVHFFASILLME